MLRVISFLNLFSLLLLFITGRVAGAGYMIDSGCDAIQDKLQNSLDEMFRMVKDTSDAIRPDNMDPDVANYYNFLFGGPDSNSLDRTVVATNLGGTLDAKAPVVGPNGQPQSAPKGPSIPGLISLNNKITQNPGRDDVVIYCDFKRWTQRNDKRWWHNLKHVIANTDTIGNSQAGRTLMITQVPGDDDTSSQEIQICPWYVNNIKNNHESRTTRMAYWLYTKLSIMHKTTQMDDWMLLDGILLHEFTHLRQGGATADPYGFLGAGSYRWAGCRKAATTASGNPQAKPLFNADSYAYLAIVIRLWGAGYTISGDGTVSTSPPRLPPLPDELGGGNGDIPGLSNNPLVCG